MESRTELGKEKTHLNWPYGVSLAAFLLVLFLFPMVENWYQVYTEKLFDLWVIWVLPVGAGIVFGILLGCLSTFRNSAGLRFRSIADGAAVLLLVGIFFGQYYFTGKQWAVFFFAFFLMVFFFVQSVILLLRSRRRAAL